MLIPSRSTPTARSQPRTPLRLGTALALTLLTTAALTPTHAQADPCRGQEPNINCDIGGGGGGGTGGGGGGSGGGGTGDGPTEPPDLGGDDEGGITVEPGDPPEQPAVPPTIDVAEQARSSAELPRPTAHTSPTGKTYVKLSTALWVDGFVTVSTPPITAGDQTVVATATPKSVIWNLGETTLTCSGPGGVGSTECSYTYKRSSASAPGGRYEITATIVWGVTWTCEGSDCDAASGTLDDLAMTSAPEAFVVSEIQTNNRP